MNSSFALGIVLPIDAVCIRIGDARSASFDNDMMRCSQRSEVRPPPVDDVLLDDNASQEQKAQFPLREASVQVHEVAGRPGVYRAVSFLRPHFQLDELTVSLRLVAELPKAAS